MCIKRFLFFIVTGIALVLASSAYAATWTFTQNTPFVFDGTTNSSGLFVSGVFGNVSGVHVTLTDIHTNTAANGIQDFEVLLVGPQGQKIILFSFVCKDTNGPVDFTFAPEASGTLPQGDTTPCTSGTYLPSDFSQAAGGYILDSPPAPMPPYSTDLTSLNGEDPYGDWTLYAEEFEGQQGGTIVSWTLEITTVPACDTPPYITTESLADGIEGVPYSQIVESAGGTPSHAFFIMSGELPPGLTLDYTGIISGTPDVGSANTYNFTVLVEDGVIPDCYGTKDLSITITGPDGCIYEDLFNDDALTWVELKPTVTETGGFLVLTPTKKKAYATSDPVFAGVQTGTTTVEIQFTASTHRKKKASMFTNWFDKKNFVEIQFNIAKGRIQLKQRAGMIVAKAKGDFTFAEDTLYMVVASFNGASYQVSIDGTVVATLTPSGTIPSGKLGFSSRAITTQVNRACVAP
jgi:subtilisin-like proprotein convertase family protein